MGALALDHDEHLSQRDFDRVRELVRQQCGIQLSADKHTMVEVRLRRRLRALGLSNVQGILLGPLRRRG